MQRERTSEPLSELLRYLARVAPEQGLPSLTELSRTFGLSVAALREQLEVARALGLVEVRPRTGTRRLPYGFLPAVRQSMNFAIAEDRERYFTQFADLRKHIEASYWHEAVTALTEEDRTSLRQLMADAWAKLRGTPVQIPHGEHRRLHLTIFSRLDNPFVTGLLEAYWEAYEAIGLNVYTEYRYLEEVWTYHQKMVDAICSGDIEAGYQAMLSHTDLIHHRPPSQSNP